MGNHKLIFRRESTLDGGFTLIEVLVALAVFLIISAATFSLFAQHQPIFNQQQNLAEVNISLRNAVAQMQLDIANAGANYYTGVNIPNYPVGVAVTNSVVASGGDCRSGAPLAYGANCFDSFSIITADSATPPVNPRTSTGTCITTSNAATIYLGPPPIPPAVSAGYATSVLATAAASHYDNGDQILLVNQDGSQYTTMKLSADGSIGVIGAAPNNNYVTLTLHSTTSTTTPGLNAVAANDVYGMTTNANSKLGEQYCSADWLLRITPIQYMVDRTVPTNPVLTRTVAGTVQTLSQKTLATQIIGFKVGVSLYNGTTDTDTTTYNFDASAYNNGTAVPYNYTLIRSVMISLIGRTNPVTDPTYKFRNSFDSGAYQIQGVSVVVNPRNMSMSD